MKAYRLLTLDEYGSGNKLTEMGRTDVKRFASELREILLELGMPREVIDLIQAPNNLPLSVEVCPQPSEDEFRTSRDSVIYEHSAHSNRATICLNSLDF